MTDPTIRSADLYVNHVEVGGQMEWSMTCEEILGGIGRANLRVQDRTNVWEPQCHWDVKIVIHDTGFVLFRGEIISEPVELPVQHPFRIWALDCADYNWELDWRLVGAPDGNSWEDPDGFGNYVAIDPSANSNATDRITVQTLLAHYITVDGSPFETSTFVGEYLPGGSFDPIYFSYTTLRGALDELAGYVTSNLQYWLDPNLKFHWKAIPSWQELAQGTGSGGLTMMLPSFDEASLESAPFNIDADNPDGVTTLSCRELKFTFDGQSMPQVVYVKGGTGFVYDIGRPPITFPSIIPAPKKSSGKLQITINRTQFLYLTDPHTGYLVVPPGTPTLAPGTVVYGKPYSAVPNPAHPLQTANTYYKLTTGPYTGYLVDEHTNRLLAGNITVTQVSGATSPAPVGPPPGPAAPVISAGGSGWVGSHDPGKRQAYVDDQSSVSTTNRDAVGGQAIYRGLYPVLRGSFVTSGSDGWRVGQLVRITDARLPATLNGRRFVIQRVSPGLIAATDDRIYTIDFGDGPVARQSARRAPKDKVPDNMASGTTQMYILEADVLPKPNTSQVITAQLVSNAGIPWAILDKVVNWSLLVYDSDFNVVEGQGVLEPPVSQTDREGKARTVLTTGPASDLIYFIYTDTPAI
jgi:hypothetical protein